MPRIARAPVCGATFDATTCDQRGEHVCVPRVQHCLAFFSELLVHTKGRWARRRFVPARWQREEIITPLIGTVVFSAELSRYVRRYRIAWIEVARKNGKSELLAGLALYLLCGDDEQGSEVYGCACDKDQARKVFDVAKRMVALSPVLAARLRTLEQAKRIADEETGSYYEIVAADAAGNLGHNPHGVVLDEAISQRDGSLWTAMRTAMGAREQPLMIVATTAGDDPDSWAKAEHDEMVRVADEPERARHVFTFIRNLPADADPFDEDNWAYPNPALDDFLSRQSLRDEAVEARNDPGKETGFRQFRANQWVAAGSAWMSMPLWDECCGEPFLNPEMAAQRLAGRVAYAGFDLSAKFDLTAWCLLLPAGDGPTDPVDVLWRFWLPEKGLERLDKLHEGAFTRYARAGWLTVTPGSVIDYDRVIADVETDAATYAIAGADCDEWSMWPLINQIADALGLDPEAGDVTAYKNTYDRMSPGMDNLMGLVRNGRLRHHGNPLARWCFACCSVRNAPYDPNLVRPIKPERVRERSRIDAVPAAAMAVNCWQLRANAPVFRSVYEDGGLLVV